MNTRTKLSLVSLAAVFAVAMPLTSQAKQNPALDRCIELFVQEVVPADHSVQIKKESIVASTMPISAHRSKVTLVAQGEKDAKVFGTAACVIHRNGKLVSMYLRGSSPGRSKLLARNVDAKQGLRTAFADETKAF